MNFYQKLDAITEKNNSLLCVGLDSDVEKLPAICKKEEHPQFFFNKAIIDATHDLVNAYKPNTAFYESRGLSGIEALKLTCDYIKQTYQDIPIIIDAKRADIGNTNEGYVAFIFDYLGADAVTVHPYLGREALQPFLDQKDKGIIILCRTSNPGSGEFQDLTVDGKPLYQRVAENVAKTWNANGNCAVVVGATYPEELAAVCAIVGDMPILIPGVGAQGGDVEKTVKANGSKRAMINSSRGILFASSGDDFAEAARAEAQKLRDTINQFRGGTI